MSSPEEIASKREAAERAAQESQKALIAQELRSRISVLIPKALGKLAEQGWPLDGSTFGHKRIIWHGEEKLCWLLRDGRGDGDYHQVYLLSTGELVETDYNSDKGYRANFRAYGHVNYLAEVVDSLNNLGTTPEEREAALRQTVSLAYPEARNTQWGNPAVSKLQQQRMLLGQKIKRLAVEAAEYQRSLGLPGFNRNGIIERLSLGCSQARGVGEVFLNANGVVMRVQQITFGVNGWHDVDIRSFDETFPVPSYLEAIQEHVRVQEHVIAELSKLLPPKNFLKKLFS